MDVSVIICTRDRAGSLDRALASIAACRKPAGWTWELIVVDNGSSDDTQAVILSHGADLPLRGAAEPRPGLSNARNAGVAAAAGERIIWTDDDVVVDEGWLVAYAEAFAARPDAAVFGGAVVPVLEPPSPAWLTGSRRLTATLFAERDPAKMPKAIEPGDLPFGANFAVLRSAQAAHPYDPRLGVGPGQRRVGEETAVLGAILGAGGAGVWVPASIVRHQIPAERQTLAYFARYHAAQGETNAYLARRDRGRPDMATLLGHAALAVRHGLLYRLRKGWAAPERWLGNLRLHSEQAAALRFYLRRDAAAIDRSSDDDTRR